MSSRSQFLFDNWPFWQHHTLIRSHRRALLLVLAAFLCVSASAKAEDDFGVDGRIGHIAFPAFGRTESITHLEFFPYMTVDHHMLFGDFRGFMSNDVEFGGNLGLGYRFVEPTGTAFFGISGWYDADQTTGELFHQLGLNLEARSEYGGLATNFYWPVGDNAQELSRNLSNVRFEDNKILFDLNRTLGDSMTGADVTASILIPGQFAIDHDIELSGGAYFFHGENAEDITGWKVSVTGMITEDVSGQVAITDDGTFGTNTTVGLGWRFGTTERSRTVLKRQLRRFVDRNYNIIVSQRKSFESNVEAINPLTGSAYIVQHVGTSAGGTTGSPDNPWMTVGDAQTAGADIIFVHSDTTLNENIVLTDGQALLGEGGTYTFMSKGHGRFTLPTATSGTMTPTLQATNGDVLTLANGNKVAGFNIMAPNGNGIVADGVDGFDLSDITIDGVSGNGIHVVAATGGMIRNTSISNTGGHGLHIVDIDDVLTVDNLTVDSAGGNGVFIEGGHGEINFKNDLMISNSGGAGFAVEDLETIVNILNAGTDDEEEEEIAGTVNVEQLEVTGSGGSVGVLVENSEGIVQIKDITATITDGTAVKVTNSEIVLLDDGELSSTNAPVIDVMDSEISFLLTSISADGGATGLNIQNSTGNMFVYGNGSEGTGGTIQNVDLAVNVDGFERFGLQRMNFVDNAVIGELSDVESAAFWYLNVTGTTDKILTATNVQAMEVAGSVIEQNALSSDSAIDFIVDTEGAYVASFIQNTVVDTDGIIFNIDNSASVDPGSLSYSFSSNDITLSGSQSKASEVTWKGTMQASLTSNYIEGTEVNQIGFDIKALDSSDLAQATIYGNSFILSGQSSTGVKIFSDAPANVQVVANLIEFGGQSGTGVSTTLGEASNVIISSNQIIDNAGGATAILFPSVADGSSLTIENNQIDLSNFNAFVDRGIILSAITGTDPNVVINSTVTNTILGATTATFLPATGWTGQLLITE